MPGAVAGLDLHRTSVAPDVVGTVVILKATGGDGDGHENLGKSRHRKADFSGFLNAASVTGCAPTRYGGLAAALIPATPF